MVEGLRELAPRRADRRRRRRQPRHPAPAAGAERHCRSSASRRPSTTTSANTERAIGYSTAVAIATEALDRLQPTGASHDAGHGAGGDGPRRGPHRHRRRHRRRRRRRADPRGALAARRRGGAHRRPARAPAAPRRWSWWRKRPARSDEAPDAASDAPDHRRRRAGWRIGSAQATGAEARATVLGHVQRGAMPTAEDRLLARRWACARSTCWPTARPTAWWRGGTATVIDVPLEKVVGRSRTVDRGGTLIRTCHGRWGFALGLRIRA